MVHAFKFTAYSHKNANDNTDFKSECGSDKEWCSYSPC